jgi:SNF2 family DNA or RNA helicase
MTKITEVSLNFTPYQWQIDAFREFVDKDLTGYALLADVGVGKTAEAITIMRYLINYKGVKRVLVIGPSVVIPNWKNEIKKYSPAEEQIICYPLSEAKKRKEVMNELARLAAEGVAITNYESFDNPEFVKAVTKWKPDLIISDELHRIKSYKSKRAKAIVDIGQGARYRLGLTGSAILNTPMDLFMQWRFIDQGKSFGNNFFNFRNRYFADANSRWAGKPNYFPKWEPREDLFGELTTGIKGNSIRVVKSECMDLPPYIEKTILLEMGPKQKKAYEQMRRDFIAFVDTGSDKPAAVVAQLALTKALRLMQIASGFATPEVGEEHIFEDNPKLDALEKILEDNEDKKVIIWCSYKANYRAIGARLDKLKIKHVFLTGEQDAKEKQESIDYFQNDGDVRAIIANRKAGGIGVNLTASSLSVVFSRNFSLEEEIQSDGRNYRGGSQVHENITKINLTMNDTIEVQAIEALKNKENIAEKILTYR